MWFGAQLLIFMMAGGTILDKIIFHINNDYKCKNYI